MEEEPVKIPIEDVLDLHTFAPADVESVAEEYLSAAREKFRTVRLIHGKGIGFQRERLRRLLLRLDFIEAFHDAPEEAGGWGATIVCFKEPSNVGTSNV